MEFMSRAIELAGIYFTTGVRWFFSDPVDLYSGKTDPIPAPGAQPV